MSKLHGDHVPGHDPADTRKGELRKPDDRDDQPGQGADLTPPDDGQMRDLRRDPSREPREEPQRR
ncbi:hypothetical protein [Lysobacter sp.]|uniref:hypothetical protein n=1 Tax=Lysobacter sp. TaxID=72226 RepID=UPI002D32B91D|nr:hypothetical protein [Lysobacter sp.]HZX76225.1 hypothetical protein [Lysobacter sp.]